MMRGFSIFMISASFVLSVMLLTLSAVVHDWNATMGWSVAALWIAPAILREARR